MGKKKKEKKTNLKKEKYAKFRKEKPSTLDISMPELTPEQQKQKQDADKTIGRFLKFNRPFKRKEKKK